MIRIPFRGDILNMGLGIERGKDLLLHKLEAFYLNEIGLLTLNISLDKKEEKIYKVFKFLFERGYPVRFSQDTDFLRVQRKGFRKGEERTQYLVKVVDEVSKEEMFKDLELASKIRKELVYAFVEDDIKFIGISRRTFP